MLANSLLASVYSPRRLGPCSCRSNPYRIDKNIKFAGQRVKLRTFSFLLRLASVTLEIKSGSFKTVYMCLSVKLIRLQWVHRRQFLPKLGGCMAIPFHRLPFLPYFIDPLLTRIWEYHPKKIFRFYRCSEFLCILNTKSNTLIHPGFCRNFVIIYLLCDKALTKLSKSHEFKFQCSMLDPRF